MWISKKVTKKIRTAQSCHRSSSFSFTESNFLYLILGIKEDRDILKALYDVSEQSAENV